ncbi:MAG: hypothetical protein ABIA37_03575 [Candidatus Woesearchaeota archaeon]
MNDQDQIFSFLKFTGPVLPTQVAKHINTSILLASAHLSDLASQGKVKISGLKIGGSPLYFVPEHKEKLQNFIHNLNVKDQDVVNNLKEKNVLKDHDLDLLSRVSLRNMKDFAIQLTVNYQGEKEIFWKWYMLSDEQASEYIKDKLSPPSEQPSAEEKKAEEPKEEPVQEITEPVQKVITEEKQVPAESEETAAVEPEKEKTKQIDTNEEKKEEKEVIKENKKEKKEDKTEEKTEAKPSAEKDQEKKHLFQKLKEKLKSKKKETADDLFSSLELYFKERNIVIQSKETVRKNAEMNLWVEVPSVLGRLTYFCKAKNKKKCDEKDISAAYMEAQAKKLPLLFLHNSEITKKAQEMLDSGAFDNLTIKKIE